MAKNAKRAMIYNDSRFNRIVSLSNKFYLQQALTELYSYLEDYPKDAGAFLLLADVMMKNGDLEEAEAILNDVSGLFNLNKKQSSKYNLMLIKLLCSKQEYSKALELLRDNINMFEEMDIPVTATLFFLRKKLSLLIDGVDYHNSIYFVDQIYDYSEEDALASIKSIETANISYFFDYDLVDELYYRIRKMLPTENISYNSILSNTYIFKYDSIGKVGDRVVNYIKVVSVQGSNDIITMYPYENRERASYIDINPYLEDVENGIYKSKRMSRIDKFNQRYGKMVD